MPTTRKLASWISIFILGLCVLLQGLRLWIVEGDAIRYLWIELPKVRAEIARMPGVTIINVHNISPSMELDVYVTFLIDDKGTLELNNPTLDDFTGKSFPRVTGIKACQNLHYPDWGYKTVVEIIDHYDEILAQFQGRCG